jgi:hypothetical protein
MKPYHTYSKKRFYEEVNKHGNPRSHSHNRLVDLIFAAAQNTGGKIGMMYDGSVAFESPEQVRTALQQKSPHLHIYQAWDSGDQLKKKDRCSCQQPWT